MTGLRPENGPVTTSSTTSSIPSASWGDLERAHPDFASTVRTRFEAFRHHILATLHADGSPRTSGIETTFRAGHLWLGSMPDARKSRDLRRDPRFALSANPGAGTDMGGGDVRISGRAVEVGDGVPAKAAYVKEVEPPEPFHLFRTELTEVTRTYVEDDTYLVVQVWKPGAPVRTLRRT